MEKIFSQIRLHNITPNLLRVFVKQNNFIAGEIDLIERTFYSVPRSAKNLFHLYHGDEGGLGINEEILHLDSFDKLKIKFNDIFLITTRRKWLGKGVVSSYCNSLVDKQIILALNQINLDDTEKYKSARIQQQELFVEKIQ